MNNPSQAYNSNSIPFGGLNVDVLSATVDATGAVTGAAKGTYALMSASPTPAAVLIERQSINGGDGGWVAVNGVISGSATLQLATTATDALVNGDYFEAELIQGQGSQRWVILDPSVAVESNGARQQTCTIRCDQFA